MNVPFLSLLLAVLLLSEGAMSAQTETVIDGRGELAQNEGAGWSAGLNPDTTLVASFTVDNPTPKPGSAVNYELRITNMGEKAVAFPRSLHRKLVENGSLEQQYFRANVTLELRTEKALTYITPTMNLYSTAEKPETSLLLRPGDSLRLIGTAIIPLTAFSPPETASLTGHLCVHQVSKTFAQSSTGHKLSSNQQQMLWCVNADDRYEVHYAEQR